MIPDIRRALAYLEMLESATEPAARHAPAPVRENPLAALDDHLAAAARVEPEAGQVWTAEPPDDLPGAPALVLLTRVREPPWRAVIASTEAWIATNDDLVVPGDQSPTGAALTLCMDRDVPVHRSSLRMCLGAIAEAPLRATLMLLQHRLTGGFAVEALEVVPREQVPGSEAATTHLVRWNIRSKQGAEAELLSGPAVVDADDLRLPVRAALESATRYVESVALADGPVDEEASEGAFARLRAKVASWRSGAESPPAGVTARRPWDPDDDLVPVVAGFVSSLPATFGGVSGALFALRAASRSSGEDDSLTLEVHFEDAVVELDVSREADFLAVSGQAREPSGKPVAGIEVTVSALAPGEETQVPDGTATRITSARGAFVPITLANLGPHVFRAEVRHRGESRVVEW
jgi:hypothetical protein